LRKEANLAVADGFVKTNPAADSSAVLRNEPNSAARLARRLGEVSDVSSYWAIPADENGWPRAAWRGRKTYDIKL
jgi:hypothetical protein